MSRLKRNVLLVVACAKTKTHNFRKTSTHIMQVNCSSFEHGYWPISNVLSWHMMLCAVILSFLHVDKIARKSCNRKNIAAKAPFTGLSLPVQCDSRVSAAKHDSIAHAAEQRGTLTKPFQCDLQTRSRKTQWKYARRLHKLQPFAAYIARNPI